MRWWIGVGLMMACSSTVATQPATRTTAAVPVDSDGDGVPDACDFCPRQVGYNRVDHPSGRGCPWIDCFVEDGSKPIRFARDRTAPPDLAELAEKMRAEPEAHVIIVGHASSDEKDPERTALERARNVMAALVAAGVDEKRLEAHGAGAVHPLDDAAGSRRVELEKTRWCAVKRAWNESSLAVVSVSWGELPSCPPELRL